MERNLLSRVCNIYKYILASSMYYGDGFRSSVSSYVAGIWPLWNEQRQNTNILDPLKSSEYPCVE